MSVPGTARIAQFKPPPTPPLSQPSPPCLRARAQASTLALDYAGRNGAGVTGGDVVFSTTQVTNDTVQVTARRTVPGPLRKPVRHRVRHGARTCQGPQRSPGTGEVRGADRSRHQAPDAPVRAPAVLQPADAARSREDRSRRLPADQHRRLTRWNQPGHPGRLDAQRLRRLHAARLVLLGPGREVRLVPHSSRSDDPDWQRAALPRVRRHAKARARTSSTRWSVGSASI